MWKRIYRLGFEKSVDYHRIERQSSETLFLRRRDHRIERQSSETLFLRQRDHRIEHQSYAIFNYVDKYYQHSFVIH